MVRSLFNVIEANGYGEAVLEEWKHRTSVSNDLRCYSTNLRFNSIMIILVDDLTEKSEIKMMI